MKDMLRAEDIMIPLERYPHIPYWFTLRQAMAEMEHALLDVDGRVSMPRFILIFDEQYQLMGLARRRDILKGLEPEFLLDKSIDERRLLFNPDKNPNDWEYPLDKVVDATQKRGERAISEVMRPIDVTADYRDHVFQIIYDMNVNEVSLLPVLKDGSVVGVVRTVDVFHEVSQFML